jgi:hypothetical protein
VMDGPLPFPWFSAWDVGRAGRSYHAPSGDLYPSSAARQVMQSH